MKACAIAVPHCKIRNKSRPIVQVELLPRQEVHERRFCACEAGARRNATGTPSRLCRRGVLRSMANSSAATIGLDCVSRAPPRCQANYTWLSKQGPRSTNHSTPRVRAPICSPSRRSTSRRSRSRYALSGVSAAGRRDPRTRAAPLPAPPATAASCLTRTCAAAPLKPPVTSMRDRGAANGARRGGASTAAQPPACGWSIATRSAAPVPPGPGQSAAHEIKCVHCVPPMLCSSAAVVPGRSCSAARCCSASLRAMSSQQTTEHMPGLSTRPVRRPTCATGTCGLVVGPRLRRMMAVPHSRHTLCSSAAREPGCGCRIISQRDALTRESFRRLCSNSDPSAEVHEQAPWTIMCWHVSHVTAAAGQSRGGPSRPTLPVQRV